MLKIPKIFKLSALTIIVLLFILSIIGIQGIKTVFAVAGEFARIMPSLPAGATLEEIQATGEN